MNKFLRPSIFLLFLFLCNHFTYAGLLKPLDVIEKKGTLALSDGSSVYIFNKDHSFESGPLGMSGRTIRGTWKKHKSGKYLIVGTWSWVNGFSRPNDFREMMIHIGSLSDEVKEQKLPMYGKKIKIYSAYFFIESLKKQETP